jgi:hypothetical protein
LPEQAEDRTCRRRWQTKELEGVWSKAVTAFAFKLVREIHYGQGFERAFFDAYTAADA